LLGRIFSDVRRSSLFAFGDLAYPFIPIDWRN
jgi:hypothetical protein